MKWQDRTKPHKSVSDAWERSSIAKENKTPGKSGLNSYISEFIRFPILMKNQNHNYRHPVGIHE